VTSVDLSKLSIDQLLDRFVELSLQDERAANIARVAIRNQLVVQIGDVKKELQNRPGDQRDALVVFFTHPNLYVRYHAATNLMSMMPVEARLQMEAIADSKIYPIAGHAGTYLVMQELAVSEDARSK
jgi:hypothetical protein